MSTEKSKFGRFQVWQKFIDNQNRSINSAEMSDKVR